MKKINVMAILLLSFGFSLANATIDSPSCSDLTNSQINLLKRAAKAYVLSKQKF